MKRTSLAVGVAIAFFAGAMTANAATTQTQTNSAAPAYADPVIADADAMKAADELHKMNFRQQLQDQLTKAGYTSVKVTPTSFFVEAKDKKGEPVAMVIGPDSVTEVTEMVQKPSNVAAQQTPSPEAPKK